MATLLEEVMSQYDVSEVHELWVPADPAAAYEAVLAVSAGEVRLFGPLMRLRTLGRSGASGGRWATGSEAARSGGAG